MTIDFAAPWDKQPLVVIDFESTGVDPLTAMPVELAASRFENGKHAATMSTLLNPGLPIPAEATAVHGITDEMVQGSPTLADAIAGFYEILADATPVAYQATYDRALLHRFAKNEQIPALNQALSWLDVFVIVASPEVDKFTTGAGRLKLSAACKRRGVELGGAHRAGADARATGELLFKLLSEGMVKSVPIGQLLKHTDSARKEHEAEHAKFRKRCLAEDRQVWRQYACAALASRLGAVPGNDAPLADTKYVAAVASEMLALEKAKFLGVQS